MYIYMYNRINRYKRKRWETEGTTERGLGNTSKNYNEKPWPWGPGSIFVDVVSFVLMC